jgi:hypothetical protein
VTVIGVIVPLVGVTVPGFGIGDGTTVPGVVGVTVPVAGSGVVTIVLPVRRSRSRAKRPRRAGITTSDVVPVTTTGVEGVVTAGFVVGAGLSATAGDAR